MRSRPDGSNASTTKLTPPGASPVNGTVMPKNKTHSGMSKRVKVTGGGKIMRQQTGLRHRLEVKSSKETRDLSRVVPVNKADVKRVKKLLGR
jgi:large subunit ribosomal protein L35